MFLPKCKKFLNIYDTLKRIKNLNRNKLGTELLKPSKAKLLWNHRG